MQGSSYKEKVCTRSTCDGGMFTYEKTTGHFLRTARLFSFTPITSGSLSLFLKRRIWILWVSEYYHLDDMLSVMKFPKEIERKSILLISKSILTYENSSFSKSPGRRRWPSSPTPRESPQSALAFAETRFKRRQKIIKVFCTKDFLIVSHQVNIYSFWFWLFSQC